MCVYQNEKISHVIIFRETEIKGRFSKQRSLKKTFLKNKDFDGQKQNKSLKNIFLLSLS